MDPCPENPLFLRPPSPMDSYPRDPSSQGHPASMDPCPGDPSFWDSPLLVTPLSSPESQGKRVRNKAQGLWVGWEPHGYTQGCWFLLASRTSLEFYCITQNTMKMLPRIQTLISSWLHVLVPCLGVLRAHDPTELFPFQRVFLSHSGQALVHDRPFSDKKDVMKATETSIIPFPSLPAHWNVLVFLNPSRKLLGKAELKVKPGGAIEHLEPCGRDAACSGMVQLRVLPEEGQLSFLRLDGAGFEMPLSEPVLCTQGAA